jgi:zinc-ribbon domain
MNQPPPLPPSHSCSRCGATIASDVNFCPACGAALATASHRPQTSPRGSHTKFFGCLLSALIVGGIALAAIVMSVLNLQRPNVRQAATAADDAKKDEQRKQRAERARIEKEEAELKASVRLTGTQVEIRNTGTFVWENTELQINGTFALFGSGKGYRLSVGDVPPAKTLKFGLMQFANSDGERFNPFARKVQSLSISAKTPHTIGFWYSEP